MVPFAPESFFAAIAILDLLQTAEPPMNNGKRHLLIVAGYVAILVTVGAQCHSLSGWLVLGVAPLLWADRHLVGLLPWQDCPRWSGALAIRVIFFAVGAVWIHSIGRGMIAFGEAVYLGFVLSMGLYLVELSIDLAIQDRHPVLGELEQVVAGEGIYSGRRSPQVAEMSARADVTMSAASATMPA
jgi:hypothetical protein